MNYRVVFHAKADAETIGLPADAFTALIETLAKVSRDPFDPAATYPTGDAQVRYAIFRQFGLCAFHIDEATVTVRVFDITWTG